MEPPKNRSHTPIVSVNDYDKIDAQYIPNTDARALSIGQSTWDRKDISLKIWRHNGKQWKGNSEEMPIHRCLDLAILFLASIKKDKNLPYPTCSLQLMVDRDDLFDEIRNFYESPDNKKHIDARLNELRNLLNDWDEREGGNNGK